MTCVHFWLIAFPEGATSEGRCKWCGERRLFLNSRDDYGPERSASALAATCTALGRRILVEARE